MKVAGKMRILLAFCAMLFVAGQAFPQIRPEPQAIVWKKAESPIQIRGVFVVPGNATLTIEPGVVVLFAKGASLRVEGELLAIGTRTEPIRFLAAEGEEPGSWEGIVFAKSAVPGRIKGVADYGSGSTLQYCEVAYGKGIWCKGSVPYLSDSYIHHHAPSRDGESGAIQISGVAESVAVIRNCSITDNLGDAISVAEPSVRFGVYGSLITRNAGSGIRAGFAETSEVKLPQGAVSTMVGNRIEGNGGGIEIESGRFSVTKNRIRGNTVGISALVVATGTLIRQNEISGHSGAGVILAGTPQTLNVTQNNLFGNQEGRAVWFRAGTPPPSLDGNYWGTTDTRQIQMSVGFEMPASNEERIPVREILDAPYEFRLRVSLAQAHFQFPMTDENGEGVYPKGTRTIPLKIEFSDFELSKPEQWRWKLDEPFALFGKADGKSLTADGIANIKGVKDGETHTLYLILTDATGRILFPNATASATFRIDR